MPTNRMEPAEFIKIVAYNLKHLRAARSLTQAKVAGDTGIGMRTYQSLESAKANPTMETIELLAQYFGVMPSRLLSLHHVRLLDDEARFRGRVREAFLDSPNAVVIRNFSGVAEWGNRALSRVYAHDFTTTPLDLFAIKSPAAQSILRAQIEAERSGIAQPYINTNVGPGGETKHFRVYPVIIYPVTGAEPLFVISRLCEVSLDSDASYRDFCGGILSCL